MDGTGTDVGAGRGLSVIESDVIDNYLKAREALAVLERKLADPRLPQDFAILVTARAAVVQAAAAVLGAAERLPEVGDSMLDRLAAKLPPPSTSGAAGADSVPADRPTTDAEGVRG